MLAWALLFKPVKRLRVQSLRFWDLVKPPSNGATVAIEGSLQAGALG